MLRMVDTCIDNAGHTGYEQLSDDTYQMINHAFEDDITFKIFGYKYSKWKCCLFQILGILFLGIPHLMVTWYKQLNVLKFKKCSLKYADVIYVQDTFTQGTIIPVKNECVFLREYEHSIKYFTYHHNKYIWKDELLEFSALKVPDGKITLNSLIDDSHGLTKEEEHTILKMYGPNKITIEVKSYVQLFIEEVINPFYLFQIFSIILWSFDEYYIYAACILFLSAVSIITSLYETRKQSKSLRDLVESSHCQTVEVCRPEANLAQVENEKFKTEMVDTVDLVPGDLIVFPPNGCIMPCDAVLLSGTCIVNESMLTGESVPVTKTPPHHSSEVYDVDLHKRHTLFSGTHVIQTRFYGGSKVIARVIRTGFYTSKGELIKSILYPKPTKFQFYKDSLKFILFMAIVAVIGMAYSVYVYIERHTSLETILIRTLDIMTIVVPPALPAAMTVGTIYSQNRLKRRNIFCISPPRINVCGKVKLICFDKTGTLTHDGLDFYGVLPCSDNKFTCLIQELSNMEQTCTLLQGMTTCHSLTRIEGKITGDPLDLSMFEATKWILEEPGNESTRFDMLAPTVVKPKNNKQSLLSELDLELPYEIGIIRQFQFSSTQQCMSVICRILGATNMTVFTKGAPEKIQTICKNDSIPEDFTTILSNYTTCGYRVIAIATKKLPRKIKWKDTQKIKRDYVEKDLEFLGLIIMQNTLKPETTPIIKELHMAEIRTVMVTGDNVLTAISVSRDCGMVLPNENIALLKISVENSNNPEYQMPELKMEIIGASVQNEDDCIIDFNNSKFQHIALEGRTWSVLRTYYHHLIPYILVHGTIFARFQPEQKTQLVMSLQSIDYIVAMCGDGANDCGALKAAHIGVSLSQAEASVAAPFTSAREDISCIKHLMLEGRCALVTSFAVFKYMAGYSLIQFFTVLLLYKRYIILGDMQFLYVDLVVITSLAITIGRQGPFHILTVKRPTGSLISLSNIIPLMLQIILCAVIQYASIYYLSLQQWFTPLLKSSVQHEDGEVLCWTNTIVFSVSCFQYLILACVYSKGHPYRQSILTNGLLLLSLVILTTFTTVLLIYPIEPLASFFEMMPISQNYTQLLFRCQTLFLPLTHFGLALLIEVCIAERNWLKKFAHFIIRKKQPKNKYKMIKKVDDSNKWSDIYFNTM